MMRPFPTDDRVEWSASQSVSFGWDVKKVAERIEVPFVVGTRINQDILIALHGGWGVRQPREVNPIVKYRNIENNVKMVVRDSCWTKWTCRDFSLAWSDLTLKGSKVKVIILWHEISRKWWEIGLRRLHSMRPFAIFLCLFANCDSTQCKWLTRARHRKWRIYDFTNGQTVDHS